MFTTTQIHYVAMYNVVPCDATQSVVMRQYVVCPSVRDVQVP